MIHHLLNFQGILKSKRYPSKQGRPDEAESLHDRSHFRCCQNYALSADIEKVNDVVIGSRAQIKEDGVSLQVFYKRNDRANFVGINIGTSRIVSRTADKLEIADASIKKQGSRVAYFVSEEILESVFGVADSQQCMQVGRSKVSIHQNDFLTAQSHACGKICADNTFPYAAFSATNGDYVNWACHCICTLNESGSGFRLFMFFLVFHENKRFKHIHIFFAVR